MNTVQEDGIARTGLGAYNHHDCWIRVWSCSSKTPICLYLGFRYADAVLPRQTIRIEQMDADSKVSLGNPCTHKTSMIDCTKDNVYEKHTTELHTSDTNVWILPHILQKLSGFQYEAFASE